MSRLGNKPVSVPSDVKVLLKDGAIDIEKGKEKLSMQLNSLVSVKLEGSEVHVSRLEDSNKARAMHGMTRSIINNMVIGVSQGFKKELTIIGVGYKAQIAGSKLTLSLGYSHPVEYQVPQGIKLQVVENTKITIEGADKHLVGEVAATIRRFRPPEPYKGKGIRYADEHIVMKEGKSVG